MHVPKDTKIIAPDLVEHWATQAALQSFHFEATPIAPQLLSLKPCYTDQGWQGFNDAFKKSGNLEAITSRHLTVSSQPKSKITVQVIKDNQWKTSIPLEIIYQNKDQKLTQSLTVDLLINRKASGDLGIMQLIAIPIQAAGASGSTGSIPVKP